MKRKPDRYECEADVVKDIEEVKKKALALAKQADALDMQADGVRDSNEGLWRIEDLRGQAHKLRVTSRNLMNVKLLELRMKLAALQTPTLPGIPGDPSIPA